MHLNEAWLTIKEDRQIILKESKLLNKKGDARGKIFFFVFFIHFLFCFFLQNQAKWFYLTSLKK